MFGSLFLHCDFWPWLCRVVQAHSVWGGGGCFPFQMLEASGFSYTGVQTTMIWWQHSRSSMHLHTSCCRNPELLREHTACRSFKQSWQDGFSYLFETNADKVFRSAVQYHVTEMIQKLHSIELKVLKWKKEPPDVPTFVFVGLWEGLHKNRWTDFYKT